MMGCRVDRSIAAGHCRWAATAVLLALSLAGGARAAEAQRVHRVPGGPEEMYANAYIIEGESGSVVVDALLTRSAARELHQRIDALSKPLLAVVVTHGHPDHYGGITQLVEGRPWVPVVAIGGVDAIIRRDDALKGERLEAFGIDWAENANVSECRRRRRRAACVRRHHAYADRYRRGRVASRLRVDPQHRKGRLRIRWRPSDGWRSRVYRGWPYRTLARGSG